MFRTAITPAPPLRRPVQRPQRKQQLKSRLKQRLKLSALLVALPSVFRGVIRDVNVLFWCAIRPFKIGAYFRKQSLRKLHLGASGNLLPGWLNTDLSVDRPGLVYLDATRRFPLPSDSIDYVFSEHMIEHIDYEQAQVMLSECIRVLKPGGTLRTSTPNLAISLQLYGEPADPELRAYQRWFAKRFGLSDFADDPNLGVFILNMGFRAWGHQFLYDKTTLSHALLDNGFTDLRFFFPLESDDPELQKIEGHGDLNGTQQWNNIEAFVIEAKKPGSN